MSTRKASRLSIEGLEARDCPALWVLGPVAAPPGAMSPDGWTNLKDVALVQRAVSTPVAGSDRGYVIDGSKPVDGGDGGFMILDYKPVAGSDRGFVIDGGKPFGGADRGVVIDGGRPVGVSNDTVALTGVPLEQF